MQLLARHGFLDGQHSLLDYGCGRGDDLAILEAAQLPARGWDPHYRPEGDLSNPADVVNLGFVLNVIESPDERAEALKRAFSLAKKCLAVAVMVVGKANTEGMQAFQDGYLSKRGTFQKYYTQPELLDFVSGVLGAQPITVAPGVVFVFRDELAEQRFLRNRHRREPRLAELLGIVSPLTAKRARSRKTITEQYWESLQEFWKRTVQLGRLPGEEELDQDLREVICGEIGSIRKAAALARKAFGLKALNQAEASRTEDLTVYFALQAFNKRPRYRELPLELQRDIKAFFGSYKSAEAAGQALLFSLGEPATIRHACQQAASNGFGFLDDDEHSLQLQAGLIEKLPAPLRVYVACAEHLYGDIDTADVVKIHVQSGKLSLMYFDDFEGKPLPALVERVKIKLRRLDVDFFDYRRYDPPPLLYMKSRYMSPKQRNYRQQWEFDKQLLGLGLFDFSGYGPNAAEFWAGLAEFGLEIRDFRLVKAT
jgi:DNA phosphorothioation-associated putative methyltransferase